MRSRWMLGLVVLGACGGTSEDPNAAAMADDLRPQGIYGAWVLDRDPTREMHLSRSGRYVFLPSGADNALYRGAFALGRNSAGDTITWENDEHAHAIEGSSDNWELHDNAQTLVFPPSIDVTDTPTLYRRK